MSNRKNANSDNSKSNSGFITLPLLKVGEAARYLGVGRKILYQLIERGEIRVVKSKGALLVEKESLDSFRKSGRLT